MAYTVLRTLTHRLSLDSFTTWCIYDISYENEIQPLYPELTKTRYRQIINEALSLMNPLSVWTDLFSETPGFIEYSYHLDVSPSGYVQEFKFTDKASLDAWQEKEDQRSANRLSKWRCYLGVRSIDYANFTLEGTQLINNITNESTTLEVFKYLSSRYFILRETNILVEHSDL
jgi:hypothetical protein